MGERREELSGSRVFAPFPALRGRGAISIGLGWKKKEMGYNLKLAFADEKEGREASYLRVLPLRGEAQGQHECNRLLLPVAVKVLPGPR
jgi:hypothetical protein